MNKMRITVALVTLVFLLGRGTAKAADTAVSIAPDTSRLQACILGSFITYMELGVTISTELTIGRLTYGISYIKAARFPVLFSASSGRESTEEISILIGKSFNFRYGYFSFSSGVSYVDIVRPAIGASDHSNGDEIHYEGVGVPIRANIVLKAYYFGMGLQFTSNINTAKPIIGIGPIVYFGSFRDA
jgi:hypothetical protein